MIVQVLSTLFAPSLAINKSHQIPLTTREALSGITGSVSLACWLFLLLPQLIENYRNQSADAISLGFIFIWFLGDICNLGGAVWAGLVPVVVAIACYFCVADGVLIGQCTYYGIRNKRLEGKRLMSQETARTSLSAGAGVGGGEETPRVNGNGSANQAGTTERPHEADENEPLLRRNRTLSGSITIPGSGERRRSSASMRRRRSSAGPREDDALSKILEESDPETGATLWFRNLISILAIVLVGAAGWAMAYASGVWKPTHLNSDVDVEDMAAGAQVLGYASAVAYLGARIPQIIKNARERSCEGLSLLFFILSLLGNLTYGAGILCHSTDKEYVLKNLPWLIGSLGTMAEDVTIFVQFHIYGHANKREEDESAII